MIITIRGKRYRWRPEVAAKNILTIIAAGAIALGIGGLIGFWFVSLL